VAFINAALVILLLMSLLAFAIATAQQAVITTIRAHLAEVKRLGGWMLIMLGVWFILLALFAQFFTAVFPV
jgi:cytochrome c biogenesis protein CcdA